MDIPSLLPTHPWANRIQYFDELESTNTYLQKLAAEGAEAGTVIIAGSQSAGKGRLGRSFHSPAGSGLYMSVLLRPNCKPEDMMHLTCSVAVAVCRAVKAVTGLQPQIKWVNDIVCHGKKLGGILTGLSVDGTSGLVSWAIVGIGINCNTDAFPPELQNIAVSLSHLTGSPVDRSALAAALIEQLFLMDNALLTQKSAYMAEYRKNCVVTGRQVQLIRGDEIRDAFVLDIDDQGGLLVRLPDGTQEHIQSGEVSLRGVEGYTP